MAVATPLSNLGASTPLAKAKLIDEPPVHESLGLREARLIAPGAPERSVLYQTNHPPRREANAADQHQPGGQAGREIDRGVDIVVAAESGLALIEFTSSALSPTGRPEPRVPSLERLALRLILSQTIPGLARESIQIVDHTS